MDKSTTEDQDTLAQLLFDHFVGETAAARNKRAYLQDTSYFNAVTESMKGASARDEELDRMTKQLKVEAPEKEQVTAFYTVSFSADTAKRAQDVLAGYLAHTNALALAEVDGVFRKDVSNQLLDWEAQLARIKVALQATRREHLDGLQNSLETAKAAGIENYLVGREESGSTVIEISSSTKAYMLGKKYLSAELETTREAPLVFPANYDQIKHKLEQTRPLMDYKPEAQAYSYVLPPTLPVQRDKPKRKLIVVVGALLGGMLGVLWVLLADALRRRRAIQAGETAA